MISVDGEVIGLLPLRRSRLLTVGQHQLKVTAPDHESTVRTIQISAGQTTTLTIVLRAIGNSAAPGRSAAETMSSRPPISQPPITGGPPTRAWLSHTGIAAMLIGSAALLAAGIIGEHNQHNDIYKPLAIAGSACQIVGFGLFLLDQSKGSPSPGPSPPNRVAVLRMSWSF